MTMFGSGASKYATAIALPVIFSSKPLPGIFDVNHSGSLRQLERAKISGPVKVKIKY
jgi:hypothetical protein